MRGTMTAVVQYLVGYMVGVYVLSCMVPGTIGSTNAWGVTASSSSTSSTTIRRQIQVIGQPAPDVVLVPVAGPPTVSVVDVPAPTPVAVGTTPIFGHLPCNLCGANDSGEIQFGSNVIMMDGTFDFLTSDITCSELYTNAVNAVYSPPNCFLLRISYLPDYCGCPTEDGTIRTTSTPVMVSSPVPTESPIVVGVVEPIVPTTPAPITTAPVVLLPLTTAPTTVPPTTMAPTTMAPTTIAPTAAATAIITNYTIPNLYITLYQVNDTMPGTIAAAFINAITDALLVESSSSSSEGESVPPYNTTHLLPTNSSIIEYVSITWTSQTLLVPSSAGTVPDGTGTTLIRQRNLLVRQLQTNDEAMLLYPLMIELYVVISTSSLDQQQANDTDTTLESNVVQYLNDNSYTILEQVQQFPYFDTVDEFIVTTEEVNVTDLVPLPPTPTTIITTVAPVGIPLPTLAPVLVNLPTRTPMVRVPTNGSGSIPSKDNTGGNGISSTGIAFLIILIIVIIVVIFYLRYHHNKKQEAMKEQTQSQSQQAGGNNGNRNTKTPTSPNNDKKLSIQEAKVLSATMTTGTTTLQKKPISAMKKNTSSSLSSSSTPSPPSKSTTTTDKSKSTNPFDTMNVVGADTATAAAIIITKEKDKPKSSDVPPSLLSISSGSDFDDDNMDENANRNQMIRSQSTGENTMDVQGKKYQNQQQQSPQQQQQQPVVGPGVPHVGDVEESIIVLPDEKEDEIHVSPMSMIQTTKNNDSTDHNDHINSPQDTSNSNIIVVEPDTFSLSAQQHFIGDGASETDDNNSFGYSLDGKTTTGNDNDGTNTLATGGEDDPSSTSSTQKKRYQQQQKNNEQHDLDDGKPPVAAVSLMSLATGSSVLSTLALGDDDDHHDGYTTAGNTTVTGVTGASQKYGGTTEEDDESDTLLFQSQKNMIKRDVIAPPGKLGIVVDTTIEGPVVHKIFVDSPLSGQIFIGDIIVGVDDVDIRCVSSADFTTLMYQKKDNVRKLTILSHDSINI